MRWLLRIGLALVVVAAGLFLVNSSRLAAPADGQLFVIAHRGLGQTFDREGLTGDTCTAARIFTPEHPFIENTIASVAAAFDHGADIVEFDVQPTTDGEFVVFHDWTLECRTDATGPTRNHSLAELRALDVGYGYTADGGATFPFRGKGVGMMATLNEMLDAFPGQRFLINVKSDDPEEGVLLADYLGERPAEDRERIAAYGGSRPMAELSARLPEMETLGASGLKDCLIRYLALGWSGYVPADCRDGLMMVPANIAPWLWGFPHRLASRLAAHGGRIVLLGPYDGSGFSSGIDNQDELSLIPNDFSGGIWTNRIDLIGPPLDDMR